MKNRIKKMVERFKDLPKKQMLAIVSMILVGVMLCTFAGTTLAKYVKEMAGDSLLRAKDFHFESNLLKEGGATYNIGTNTISFDLMNYDDDLRKSELDIAYNVTITCSDGNVQLPQGTNTSGTVSADAANKTTVTYTGLTFGKSYTVTARATSPYTKTISATFIVPTLENAISYSVEETEYYVCITLTTTNYTGNVNITWQNGYVPDNSNPLLTSATGTSHTATIPTVNSVYELRFFKTDMNTVFDSSKFTVTAN